MEARRRRNLGILAACAAAVGAATWGAFREWGGAHEDGPGASIAPPATIEAEPKDDAPDDYLFAIPYSWEFKPVEPFAKYGGKQLAEKALDYGQGARALLCVTPRPPAKDFPADYGRWLADWQQRQLALDALEGDRSPSAPLRRRRLEEEMKPLREKVDEALLDLAQSTEYQRVLMSRFGDLPSSWPTADYQPITTYGDKEANKPNTPAVLVKTHGLANNLGNRSRSCDAEMTILAAGRRICRLCAWIWKNAHDREHLRDDVDYIEMKFEIPSPATPPK